MTKPVARILLGVLLSTRFLCFAQFTAVSQGPNARNLDPSRQTMLTVKDDEVRVTSEPRPFPYVLTIEQVPKPIARIKITLPYELSQIDELSLWQDKILVRGMLNNAAAMVMILDKKTGQQIDSIRGYWPSISLNHGLILFTKMYPTHFADGTEDHYMVYWLERTPAENRPPGKEPLEGRPVGIPLYPLNIGNVNFDNINLPEPWHAQTAAGFFWNDEGTLAVTLDTYDDTHTLVLFRFNDASVSVEVRELTNGDICPEMPAVTCSPPHYLSHAKFVRDSSGAESLIATLGYPQSPPGIPVTIPLTAFSRQGERSLTHPRWTPK